VQAELARVQTELTASERALAAAADAERSALRALDQAEAARARIAARRSEIDRAAADLAGQRSAAEADMAEAEAARAALPDPAAGRAALDAARLRSVAARTAFQHALAAVSAHGQALAVGQERISALRGDIRGWQARAGDAARRLAAMEGQAEDLAGERAVLAARPPALAGTPKSAAVAEIDKKLKSAKDLAATNAVRSQIEIDEARVRAELQALDDSDEDDGLPPPGGGSGGGPGGGEGGIIPQAAGGALEGAAVGEDNAVNGDQANATDGDSD
jgi:chromosome segregation protein